LKTLELPLIFQAADDALKLNGRTDFARGKVQGWNHDRRAREPHVKAHCGSSAAYRRNQSEFARVPDRRIPISVLMIDRDPHGSGNECGLQAVQHDAWGLAGLAVDGDFIKAQLVTCLRKCDDFELHRRPLLPSEDNAARFSQWRLCGWMLLL
jgi:hypothetical protein